MPSFPATSAKDGKAGRGSTSVALTPLDIRARGRAIGPRIKDDIRVRATRAFGKWATVIRNITVRIEDVNGPKGGVDTRFAVQVLVDGYEPIHVEHSAATLAEAEAATLKAAEQRLKKLLARLGRAAGRVSVPGPSAPPKAKPRRTTQVTTHKRDDGMAVVQEESSGRPSRKSTRRSSNRSKSSEQLQRTVQLKANSSSAVAARAGHGGNARPRIRG